VTAIHPTTLPPVSRDFLVSPNPSAGPFTLRFSFAGAASDTSGAGAARTASLSIVSVTGRMVRQLWRGAVGTRETLLGWDGRDARGEPVPQGVYYARLSAGGAETTRPIVVIR